jgi:hypothetical protein
MSFSGAFHTAFGVVCLIFPRRIRKQNRIAAITRQRRVLLAYLDRPCRPLGVARRAPLGTNPLCGLEYFSLTAGDDLALLVMGKASNISGDRHLNRAALDGLSQLGCAIPLNNFRPFDRRAANIEKPGGSLN